MRLRRCLAVSLSFIAQSTFATAQVAAQPSSLSSASSSAQPAPQSAAARLFAARGASRFELQRQLAELDERRRRLRSTIDPADSVLRLLAADTLKIASSLRPISL